MTAINQLSFGRVGEAFRGWIRRYDVAYLAKQFGVADPTIRRWHGGGLPRNDHLVAMVEVWGEPFLQHLFAPVLLQTRQDLLSDLDGVGSDEDIANAVRAALLCPPEVTR